MTVAKVASEALAAQVDTTSLYRRAEVERRIARGILDGKDEKELCDLLGLPRRDVNDVVTRLADRVQSDSVEIARIHAIKQTGMLTALYMDSEKQWQKTNDPRYAEVMRGALADTRKIWGVEAPQRIALGGTLNVKRGVLGGILGNLDDRALEALDAVFTECDSGRSDDGESLPSLEGPCETGGSVSLD